MDEQQFWYLVNNQSKWSAEYRKQGQIQEDICRIINRKQKGKGSLLLKKNIINDLKSTLYADEITINETPSKTGFEVHWRGKSYSLPSVYTSR